MHWTRMQLAMQTVGLPKSCLMLMKRIHISNKMLFAFGGFDTPFPNVRPSSGSSRDFSNQS